MPFHIEIGSSFNHVRAFNVETAELWEAILEPWVRGLPFEFGEHEWEPRESRLTILEGPELDSPDPASERGWSNALRGAEDVTRPLLEAAEASAPVQTAMAIEADSLESAVKALRSGRQPRPIPWADAVERIAGRDQAVVAAILIIRRPERG